MARVRLASLVSFFLVALFQVPPVSKHESMPSKKPRSCPSLMEKKLTSALRISLLLRSNLKSFLEGSSKDLVLQIFTLVALWLPETSAHGKYNFPSCCQGSDLLTPGQKPEKVSSQTSHSLFGKPVMRSSVGGQDLKHGR